MGMTQMILVMNLATIEITLKMMRLEAGTVLQNIYLEIKKYIMSRQSVKILSCRVVIEVLVDILTRV